MTNWITFVGEGRSGHTIVSAILDSHPNLRIAEEQKLITKWWRDDWSRDQIITNVKQCGQGKERAPKALPGSLTWNEPLLYLGDKCGWDAVNLIKKQGAESDVLSKFGLHMGMGVRVIHTIRDPYENISAWLDSPKYKRQWPDLRYRTRMSIKRYSRFYSTADKLLTKYPAFSLYNEELCLDPKNVLIRLCTFLDIPVVEPWFSNAANSVFKTPHKRSDSIEWDKKLWDMVGWRIVDRYAYFDRYVK